MRNMDESKLWQDIEAIALATGRTGDEVYSELMLEFKELVESRLEESYHTGRPRLKIDEVEFRRLYNDGMELNDLATHFKISRSSVHLFRVKLHLRPRRRYMIKFDKREFKRLFKLGTPYGKMAEIFGMSRNTVMETRKRLGLKNRYNWRSKETDT